MFVQYVLARVERDVRELSYRAYVTRSLQLAPQGYYMTTSWYDVARHDADEGPDMSAEEVVDHVTARLESLT